MSEPFLGEIRIFTYNFAPRGWAYCQGQVLPIAQNQALFALLGTTYGGNGVTTFQLPDVRGRVMIGFSNSFPQGTSAGEMTHTLLTSEIPGHGHGIAVSNQAGTNQNPSGNFYAVPGTEKLYSTVGADASAAELAPAGGGQPHNNMKPSLALGVCMALQGIFPSRN